MIKAVFDNLSEPQPKNHFTVGINDDVTHTSLDYDPDFVIEPDNVFRGLFYGLGSDGTVGANKSSIKIIGEETDNYAQGYFVYDSKKSGAMTVSHLRFGPEAHPLHLPDPAPQLRGLPPAGVPRPLRYAQRHHARWRVPAQHPLPRRTRYGNTCLPNVQRQIVEKQLNFYVIDATTVGRESGMRQINTIMQVCFFAISGVLPRDEAMAAIERSIRKTYGKKGDDVVKMNLQAVSRTLEHLHKVEVPVPMHRALIASTHSVLGTRYSVLRLRRLSCATCLAR